MPTPSSVRRAVGLSRRTALGGVLATTAAALSGCRPRGIDRRPKARRPTTASPEVDPDVTLAASVLADEQRMLDQVLATLTRHPGLAAVLAGARSAHQAHVRLLTHAVPDRDRPTTPASPAAGASPSVSPSVPPSTGTAPRVPARVPVALATLAGAEDQLSLLGRRSAFTAQSGAFARVLASMAASASQQSVALSAAARERR